MQSLSRRVLGRRNKPSVSLGSVYRQDGSEVQIVDCSIDSTQIQPGDELFGQVLVDNPTGEAWSVIFDIYANNLKIEERESNIIRSDETQKPLSVQMNTTSLTEGTYDISVELVEVVKLS